MPALEFDENRATFHPRRLFDPLYVTKSIPLNQALKDLMRRKERMIQISSFIIHEKRT
jgi:hypothetical protein